MRHPFLCYVAFLLFCFQSDFPLHVSSYTHTPWFLLLFLWQIITKSLQPYHCLSVVPRMYHAVFLVALSVLFLFSSDVCLLSATLQSTHARVVLWCDCVRVCAWMQYEAVLLLLLSVPFLFCSNLLLCCKMLMHALFYGVTVCGCACVFVSMCDG